MLRWTSSAARLNVAAHVAASFPADDTTRYQCVLGLLSYDSVAEGGELLDAAHPVSPPILEWSLCLDPVGDGRVLRFPRQLVLGASVRHAHGDAAEQRFAVGGRDREDPLRHDESGPAMSRQTLGSHSVWLPRALTTSLGHYQHKQPRRPPHNPPKTPVFTRFRVTTRVTINVAQMVAVTY